MSKRQHKHSPRSWTITGTSGFYRGFWEPDVQTGSALVQTCDPRSVLSLAEAKSSCFTRTPARPDKTIAAQGGRLGAALTLHTENERRCKRVRSQRVITHWEKKKEEEILSDCDIIIVMMTLLEPASLHRLEKSLSSYVGNTLNNNRSIITGTQISSGITQKQRSAKPGLQLGQYSSVRRASMLVFCPAMYL